MARKTKQESAQTRERLLDAAEIEMQAQGVSRTSLESIASRAEVTRGALYWHFSDKNAILKALIARTHLPLRDLRDDLAERIPRSDPRRLLREMLLHTMQRLANDSQHQRISDILLHRHEAAHGADAVTPLLSPLFKESRAALIKVCEDVIAHHPHGADQKLGAVAAADVILAFICGVYECHLRHGCNEAAESHREPKVDALLAGLFPAAES